MRAGQFIPVYPHVTHWYGNSFQTGSDGFGRWHPRDMIRPAQTLQIGVLSSPQIHPRSEAAFAPVGLYGGACSRNRFSVSTVFMVILSIQGVKTRPM